MTAVQEYLQVAGVIRSLLASPEVAKYWDYPSALDEWTVAGLSGHLARPVLNLASVLEEPVPWDSPLYSAVDYYAQMPAGDADLDSPAARAIRLRGVESAGADIADLLERYDKALAVSSEQLPPLPADHEIGTPTQGGGVRMLLSEYLITRMIEMLVHADDLAVSIGRSYPDFTNDATNTVVATLACISLRRNKPTDLLRALARQERPIDRITVF